MTVISIDGELSERNFEVGSFHAGFFFILKEE